MSDTNTEAAAHLARRLFVWEQTARRKIAYIAADDQQRADNMALGEKVQDNAAGVFWIDAHGNPVHQSSQYRDRAVYIA